MNTNKLPNLGSTGWGQSLNDYIKGIETRVSNIERDLSEITIEGTSWDITSGVVGFGGKMMRIASESDEHVIGDGEEITPYGNYDQFFWRGEVFFKDTGNGTPVYKTIDDDGETYWDIELEPDTGWTPVYLKIEEFGEGLSYLKDSKNAYLTHPFVILLGFIFYDGEKIYWHYKTSKSDESTYAKRFMLTRSLAKFNSTFDVKSNGGRSYTITGKQIENKNPILTLNAMGINYYDSNLTDESLKKGPDYKEFEISTDTPVISYIDGSSAYYADSTFTTPNTLNKRYIHRVFFSNVGRYVLQSERYDSDKGTDFSTVVSYGFDNIYSNFERYGDLVEIFRFVTEGTESSNNLVKVYQVIGDGIPPVDSFGVVPEVNYVSKEGSNNIQFTDNNNNYFTLVGQNYAEGATPKVVKFNFNNSDDNYNYHALMNYTDISTTNGIQFIGANNTVYNFTNNTLNLTLSSTRYIKMGILGGFPGIELRNDDSIVSMNNDGLLKIQADTNKRLWMGHTEGEISGVGLRNGDSSIVLADNGDIGLSNADGLIRIRSADDDDHPVTNRIDITNSKTLMKHGSKVEIKAPSVEIASSNVDIESSSVDIESSYIKIRTKEENWPEKLIGSVECVFDPQVYGEAFLGYRCMGTQHNISPVVGDVAHSIDFDINRAFYKTDDNNWCLGFWGGNTDGEWTQSSSTYLVVISRSSEDDEYKFDFVEKVEGYTVEEKEDSFVFSVSPHDTCSLAAGGREGKLFFNDAFKSEPMTNIDSALSVSGNLQIGGTSNNLTISNRGVLSSLKVGTDNYELVYLNGVNLECVNSSGELRWTDSNNYYALNNIPFILKGSSSSPYTPYDNVRVTILGNQYFASWTGSFPLRVWGNNLNGSPIVWISPRYGTGNDWMVLKRNGEEELLTSMEVQQIRDFWILNFTGLAWKRISGV